MLYLMPENSKRIVSVQPLPKNYEGMKQLQNLFHSLTDQENLLRVFIGYSKIKHKEYNLPWAKLYSDKAGLYMPSETPLYCTEELVNKYMVSLQLISDVLYTENEMVQDLGGLLQRTHQNQGQTKFIYDKDEIPFDVELTALSKKIKGIKPNQALELLGETCSDFAMFWSTIYPLIDLSNIVDECSLADFSKANPNISEIVPQNNAKVLGLINKKINFIL